MTCPIRVCVLAFAVCGGAAHAQTAAPPPPPDMAARIGGKVVTLAELDKAWRRDNPETYVRLQQELYEARRRALDEIVGEAVLDMEATARGVTKDTLLEAELPRRTRPVEESDIQATYQSVRERANGATLDQMRPSIRGWLQERRKAEARAAFIEDLTRASKAVEISLAPPRIEVAVAANDPALGPASATVQIIEFSDFQ